jgi:hypothetical protein
MKNLIFIASILIILFKTGNVLSDNNIFNVNNIVINKDISKNNENLINEAFKKGFNEIIKRLLLDQDYKKFLSININEVKKLISYYQIIDPDSKDEVNNTMNVNIFFDKEKMHNFFYEKNILYSDIINSEIIIFPLLIKKDEHFIHTKNFFFKNWNTEVTDDLIKYNLPLESVENIQKIEKTIQDIYKIGITDFFKEYNAENMAFIIIEINEGESKIFLKTKIAGKSLNKSLSVKKNNLNNIEFNNKIILEIKNVTRELIKSQNLIDVKTPSFLNVEIRLKNKSNLVTFKNRIKKIDLIDNFYVQQLNKDYALVKIKYFGKINKIINKLKNQNMNLKMSDGQWNLQII